MYMEEEMMWVYCVKMWGVESYGCHYLQFDFPYEDNQLQCPWSYMKYGEAYLICLPKSFIQQRLKRRKEKTRFYLLANRWGQITFYFSSPRHVLCTNKKLYSKNTMLTEQTLRFDT